MLHAKLSKILLIFLFSSLSVAAQNTSEIHSVIRSAVENKDYRRAAAELINLKQADEKIFTLNNYDYLLARMAEKQGDIATATVNYQAVASRNSVLSEYALWHLSQIFRFSGNFFLERIYLQKLSTLAPESLITKAVNLRMARSYFESKDFDSTIQILNSRLINIGSQPKEKLKNNEQRVTSNEQKPKIEDRETLAFLAQALLQSGKTNEASEIFTKLTDNLPNLTQPDDFALAGAKALDEIAVGKDNFGKTVPPLADFQHLRRAQIYQFNRNFALARLHYKAIVEKYASSGYVPDALYQIGRGYAQEHTFDEAINWFERVQAEFPNEPIARDALSQAASAYARVNKPKEAISRYQKFIAQYPDAENLDRAFLNIVDVLRDTGENSDALKWTMKTQEAFRGKLPEALALFAQARIHVAQNDWADALADLNHLQEFSDLGETRVPGGTNKAEIIFLKGFVLENLNRYAEAIDVYLSIPDGRGEYYGWRATERLRALANDEKTKQFVEIKLVRLVQINGISSSDEERKVFQSLYRLTDNASFLEKLKKTYSVLPEYQKIPTGKLLELGRKEILKETRETSSTNYHQVLADELLFLGLHDEAAPELEVGRQQPTVNNQNDEQKTVSKSKTPNTKSNDFDYTLASFYKRGDWANRAVAYTEPLWRNVPADYQIELIPREQIEMLYPAPYSDALLQYAPPENIDPRFILAIMRQESRYRADVKSNAAARGLMQFISTTSDKVAAELNRENFRQDELYNPPTAILFGSHYLSNLFKIFPAQPSAVAASYNGGEDNMTRWFARAKSGDSDRYVPEIIFSQSKDYVYRVMASYRVYQMIYDEQLRAK